MNKFFNIHTSTYLYYMTRTWKAAEAFLMKELLHLEKGATVGAAVMLKVVEKVA